MATNHVVPSTGKVPPDAKAPHSRVVRSQMAPGLPAVPLNAAALLPGTVLAMQHSLGNATVQRLLQESGRLPWPARADTADRPPPHAGTDRVENSRTSTLTSARDGRPAARTIPHTPSIQRLMTGDDLRAVVPEHDPLLATVDLLNDYHAQGKALTPQRKLDMLRRLSRGIYGWYNRQDTFDLKALRGPVPSVIRRLEAEVDEEHQQIVAQIMAAKQLPLDASELKEIDAQALHRVWNDLLSGTGTLQVSGSSAFKQRVHSMLVRILETAGGRQLLALLAGRRDKRIVTIGEQPPEAIKPYLSEASPTESKAIPQLANAPWRLSPWKPDMSKKDALLKELTETRRLNAPPAEPEREFFKLLQNPGDLQRAILEGRRGVRLAREDGEVVFFEFAPGARGAFVALIAKQEDLDNQNVTGKSVHTPAFITLAHELGHALNQLAGAATLDNQLIFELFGGGAESVGTYENPGPAKKKWTNPEELITIKGLENAIRDEVGLAARGGHAAAVDEALIRQVDDERWLVEMCLELTKLPSVPADNRETFSSMLYHLRSQPVKGLSQKDKRQRCIEYEWTLSSFLGYLAADATRVREFREKAPTLKAAARDFLSLLQAHVPTAVAPLL